MQLQLISLYCSITEDTGGGDEPYILVNGVKVWGTQSPGLNNTDTADLSGIPTIEFDTKARVELFDEDSPDDDDLLGRFYAGKTHQGKGELEYHFVDDGADYTLTYKVN